MRLNRAASLVAGTAGIAALLGGCAGGPGGPTGTVAGHLEMVGGPATPSGGTPVFLVPGTITAVSGSATFRASAAKSGSFTLTLPVGTYTVTGTTPQDDDGKATCVTAAPVTVRAGQETRADVVCEIA